MLYNVVLVSAIQQCEPATSVCVCVCVYVPSLSNLPPTPSFHPFCAVTEHDIKLPASYSKFLLAICFTYGNVYVSMLLSQFVLPSPSLTVSTSLYSISASLLLPCKLIHQCHFSRSHICVVIHNICFSLTYFTLYNRH